LKENEVHEEKKAEMEEKQKKKAIKNPRREIASTGFETKPHCPTPESYQ
jgi:hypothetical protein